MLVLKLFSEEGKIIWKSAKELGLEGSSKDEWITFTSLLQTFFINLENDVEYSLVWSKESTTGEFTVKLRYQIWAIE